MRGVRVITNDTLGRRSGAMKVAVAIILAASVFLGTGGTIHALDVTESKLDNGLELLIVERHALPIVKVSVGIIAGSIRESAEKAGLANLTAGLLTEGTKNRTAEQISEEIEFVGGSLGASGGDDYITVNLSVLKKDIDLGFELLSDVILNPRFPDRELSKEKEQIQGSLKAKEEDPGFVASREFMKAVFGEHPYGRLIIGTAETVENISRKDLREFHASYYVPNNAVMAVVGDVTAAEVENLVKKYFASWRSKDVSPPSLPEPSLLEKRKTITFDRDLTQANIMLGHLGVRRDNPDYYALSVMNYILGGGGFASRLMQNIREDKGLVYDIHSFFSANRYGGHFQVSLQTKNESANTGIAEVVREIKGIREAGVTDRELADAKAFLTGSFPMRIETNRRIAGFLVAVKYYGLGLDYIDNYPVYINAVSKEDILRVAGKYLDTEKFILVVVANQEKAAIEQTF